MKDIYHIENTKGKPLCTIGTICDKHHVTCGHTSIQSARSAVELLKAKGYKMKVVKGGCPAIN